MDSVFQEVMSDYRLFLVLEHLDFAKVDYAKNISKHTEIRINDVQDILRRLEILNLVEKFTNTSIKRKVARLKLSPEVHKHHTYYEISRAGHQLIRSTTPEKYLELLGVECLDLLKAKGACDSDIEKCKKLVEMGLLDGKFELTSLGNKVLAASGKR